MRCEAFFFNFPSPRTITTTARSEHLHQMEAVDTPTIDQEVEAGSFELEPAEALQVLILPDEPHLVS